MIFVHCKSQPAPFCDPCSVPRSQPSAGPQLRPGKQTPMSARNNKYSHMATVLCALFTPNTIVLVDVNIECAQLSHQTAPWSWTYSRTADAHRAFCDVRQDSQLRRRRAQSILRRAPGHSTAPSIDVHRAFCDLRQDIQPHHRRAQNILRRAPEHSAAPSTCTCRTFCGVRRNIQSHRRRAENFLWRAHGHSTAPGGSLLFPWFLKRNSGQAS